MRSTLLLAIAILSFIPSAASADCMGFLNSAVQGYKFGARRPQLVPSGAPAPEGSDISFNGMSKIAGRFYLYRTGSDLMYPADDIQLTTGCNLPMLDASEPD